MKHTYKFFVALLLPAMVSCAGKTDSETYSYQKAEGMVWNTSYHITYKGAPALSDSVTKVLSEVGSNLSAFDPNSQVSLVNRQDSTPVSDDFIRVYVMSRKIHDLTDGAFDPTLSPLISAWGFGPGHQATRDTMRVDSLLKLVGIDKTRLFRDALIKEDPRIQFNFSAIAKGYGCDRVAEMFHNNGVSDFIIEIGGEIAASGKNPAGNDWRVSVDRPIVSSDREIHDSQAIIKISDCGVATSGNYRNFKEENGARYGHTISAKTGRPVQTDVISATVIAPTAMEADGLATAFMALGSAKSIGICNRYAIPAMLILSDSTTWISPKFKSYLSEHQ